MYAQKITLHHFNNLPDITLQLEKAANEFAGWVVITGDNGAGKSYLLHSIAKCLSAKSAADIRDINSPIYVHLSPIAEHIPHFPIAFYSPEKQTEIMHWLADLLQKKKLDAQAEQQIAMLMILLNDDFLPPAWHACGVDGDGVWLGNAVERVVHWTQAGLGIRSAMCILITILRAAFAVLAPGEDVSKAAGVVLIDDIELHLHPAWQRQIGFWLMQRFPLVQFIVSTHSPLICQAAQQIVVLPCFALEWQTHSGNLTAQDISHIQTLRPDTILRTAAFGLDNTRSPLALESIGIYAKLQSKKRAGCALDDEELVLEQQMWRFVDNGED